MTPWSVRPSAGCPNSAARAASASILQAPSRSEYSEWTWRWTAEAIGQAIMGTREDGTRAVRQQIPLVPDVDYGRGMLRGLVLAALLPSAVAGGNLGVTAAPSRPFAGQRVAGYATGQVDTRGRLYVFRHLDRRCAVSERGERGL